MNTGKIAGALVICVAMASHADSIRVGDKIHENVYVTMDAAGYRILVPATGEVLAVSSARRDVKLISTSPTAERDKLRADWDRKRGVVPKQEATPPAPVGKPTVEKPDERPKRLTSNDLRQRQSFEDTAEFETQLMLWAQIPSEYREAMFQQVALLTNSEVELNAARTAELQEARSANYDALKEESKGLAKTRGKAERSLNDEAARLQRAQNTARAQEFWTNLGDSTGYQLANRDRNLGNARMNELNGRDGSYYRSWANYNDARAWDEASHAEARHRATANEYAEKEEAVRANVKQINKDYKAQAREANARMRAIEEANSRARTDETVLRMNSEEAMERAQRDLDRMSALEEALGNGYALTVPFSQAAELHANPDDEEAEVALTVKGKLWRVLWAIGGPSQGSKLARITVLDAATKKPVGGSSDSTSPYRRFLLLEGPGEYLLRVSGTKGSEVVAVAEEVAATN